jgi:hypothetical protein
MPPLTSFAGIIGQYRGNLGRKMFGENVIGMKTHGVCSTAGRGQVLLLDSLVKSEL